MARSKTLTLLVALSAAFGVCISASSALAGSKGAWASIWDPVSHAPTTTDVIHIYSFRRLDQLTGGYDWKVNGYNGSGLLKNRCGPAGARHWCATSVAYKLTNSVEPGTCGVVWAHLYVRPVGETAWREITHYNAAVVADCS